jgi:(1->4)-alpha-D-glucan 1-alpha-D-glucosylmutase
VERTAVASPGLAATVRWFGRLVLRADDVRIRWQQLSGPAMAKGAEDRAFYRHQRLSSLCEVGGQPGRWSFDIDEFHRHQQAVQAGWPTTMLAATTHDTKRSSGVRARSLALTAEADRFVEIADGWIRSHDDVVSELRGADVSLAVQTAVTAAPLDAERLGRYLVKAAREADLDTGWVEPDREYETRLETLAAAVSADTAAVDSPIGLLAAHLRDRSSSVGLRLLLLQLTVPGVPDLYQGSPMELLSLVDPDNRRPPDWARLARLVELASAQAGPVEAFDRGVDDERVDLARSVATRRVLDLRRRRPEAFGPDAGYRPIVVDGPAAASVIAFERTGPSGDRGVAATVALRAPATWGRLDGTTLRLPGGRWHRLLAGEAIRVGDEPTPVAEVVGIHGVDVLERLGD